MSRLTLSHLLLPPSASLQVARNINCMLEEEGSGGKSWPGLQAAKGFANLRQGQALGRGLTNNSGSLFEDELEVSVCPTLRTGNGWGRRLATTIGSSLLALLSADHGSWAHNCSALVM